MRYWENIMQAETILVCTRLFFDKRFTPFLLKAISNVHRYKYSLFVTRNRRIFSILTFLINIWQMNSVKCFFLLNLSLLSRIIPSDVTYEGLTSLHMAWLTFHIKMSHILLNGVTLIWVTSPLRARLILG
jgi:hypothetical protein